MGRFEIKPFKDIDLKDSFFDDLKRDYAEFEAVWFPKCIAQGREALVFSDEQGLGAFIALKEEYEELRLIEKILPAKKRLKISTLRLAERFRGQRIGEGAIGLILWQWQSSHIEDIYVTVFDEHNDLIVQLERFGFVCEGHNERGECVYLRSKNNIDFSDPYKSFPFISPDFKKGGYLIVNDYYHDTLFPYQRESTITMVKMLYGGFFGAGNNINMDWLDRNGLWSPPDGAHPAQLQLRPEQCEAIWREGKIETSSLFGK